MVPEWTTSIKLIAKIDPVFQLASDALVIVKDKLSVGYLLPEYPKAIVLHLGKIKHCKKKDLFIEYVRPGILDWVVNRL